MFLNEIIKNAPAIEIKQLSCDSRIPMKDCIFFCMKGIKYDGHHFVSEAISNGAKVIVYSDEIDTNQKAIFIKVPDVLSYLIKISNVFYNNPQSKLFTYLVGGTYGRPAVSSIISDILSEKKKVGSIGVYGIKCDDNVLTSSVPTLGVLDTQKYLHQFVEKGVEAVTLEANNLSFNYRKLHYLKPNIFIYTNTSKTKLDKSNEYVTTIQRYLYTLDDSSLIILNRDDVSYEELYKATGKNVVSYGENDSSDYVIKNIITTLDYSSFTISHKGIEVNFICNLIGLVNVYNAVASIVALAESGYELTEISSIFAKIAQREGIYEKVQADKLNIIIDAAFYIESYDNILSFAKKKTKGKLVSIISLNTSDDKNRLSNLIKIAEKYSDQIILTEDVNVDNEISKTLVKASNFIVATPSLLIEDRVTAIETGIDLLDEDDTLLILGKGNEKFINKGYIKENYLGDKTVVLNYLEKIKQDILLYEDEEF